MAGRPITRAYIRQIKEQGGAGMVLDRLAAGETFADVARGLNVSRPFLAYYLFAMPGGRAAVHVARCMAAEPAARRALAEAESKLRATGRGPTDATLWLQSRGGFRNPGEPSPSDNPGFTSAYVPEGATEMGRLHLAALTGRKRLGHSEDVAPETRSDPTDALLV